jgi:Protein of unknown function (DUF1474).
MGTKFGAGKSSSNETSVLHKLKEMVKTDAKVYYIMWKYSPHLLTDGDKIKTFEDLKKSHKCFTEGMDEQNCENWLTEQNVQTAVKWLLKRLHQQKMIELYNIYFENAKKDVAAFKAFTDFSEKFFATEKESELLSMLQNADIGDDQ